MTLVVIKATALKLFTPNDENKSLLGSYSIAEEKQLQIMTNPHANVTAVTNNQQKL